MSRFIDAELIPYSEIRGNAKNFTIENLARKSDIDNIPTADVEPIRHSKWVDCSDEIEKKFGRYIFVCLECTDLADNFIGGTENWWCIKKPKFCPNCGAKMDEQENE